MGDEKFAYGVLGTVISATGAGMSVTEIQAIVSIVVTVLGFLISVVIPLGVKIYFKLKKYKKNDGKLSEDEIEDLMNDLKDINRKKEKDNDKD